MSPTIAGLGGQSPPILWQRLLGGASDGMTRLGLAKADLESHRLVMAARRRARLDDFGAGGFRAGLDRLVASLNDDAQLHGLGRRLLQGQLTRTLEARLRIQDWVKKHPFVHDEQISGPLVVTGLPRSGATLLGQLLDLDPINRSVQGWEATDPCPPAALGTWREDPRMIESAGASRRLAARAPDQMPMQPIGATLPADCDTLLGLEFTAMHFSTEAWVPQYTEWLATADLHAAYGTHRLVLQALQSTVPTARWSLTSPTHLWHLPALLTAYPDARVIWLHRDPVQVLASASNLTAEVHGRTTSRVRPVDIGAAWSAHATAGLAAAAAARRDIPATQVFDLPYLELVDDPVGSVERIYHYFDLDLATIGRYRMDAWMTERRPRNAVLSRHPLAHFGLDADDVLDALYAYVSAYHVPLEPEPVV